MMLPLLAWGAELTSTRIASAVRLRSQVVALAQPSSQPVPSRDSEDYKSPNAGKPWLQEKS